MIRLDTIHSDRTKVTNPGVVRNFRVQVRESGATDWHMASIHRSRNEAEERAKSLQHDGVSARVVDCDRCPTAI